MLPRLTLKRTSTLTRHTRLSSSMSTPSSSSPPPSSSSPPAKPPTWSAWRLDPPSAASPTSQTFKADSQLPRLPVPNLDTTLERLRRSCAPLIRNDEQRKALEEKLAAFGKEGGVGRMLQKQLEQRREEPYVSHRFFPFDRKLTPTF
jgi:hypothetical protein